MPNRQVLARLLSYIYLLYMKFYATSQKPDSKPSSIVFLLHGWGANGKDLLTIAEAWQSSLPDTLFMCLEAPEVCDANPLGFQWFAVGDMGMETLEKGVIKAREGLNKYIHQVLKEHNVPPEKVVIMGFSQGMMMALSVGLRQEKPFAGVLGYSGAFMDKDDDLPEKYGKPAVCLVHGDADTVIPITLHEIAVEWLRNKQYKVDSLCVEGLPHGIEEKGLEKGREFLKNHL